MKISHQNPFGEGDKVRSFDFPEWQELEGERTCYVEGYVVSIDYEIGEVGILVTKDVWCGKEVPAGETGSHKNDVLYTPLNGLPSTMGSVPEHIYYLGEGSEEEFNEAYAALTSVILPPTY